MGLPAASRGVFMFQHNLEKLAMRRTLFRPPNPQTWGLQKLIPQKTYEKV